MKIIVNHMDDGTYEISIEAAQKEGYSTYITINDEAHSNITSEAEILARAAALHSATGWPVTKEYEL